MTGFSMPSILHIRLFIIREFLDGCFYDESYTVALCNQRLVDAGEVSLTPLFPPKEGK